MRGIHERAMAYGRVDGYRIVMVYVRAVADIKAAKVKDLYRRFSFQYLLKPMVARVTVDTAQMTTSMIGVNSTGYAVTGTY